jgi:hypothetical protein
MKETRFSTPVNNDTFVEMEFWCDPATLNLNLIGSFSV